VDRYFFRFDTIHAFDRRTDEQTGRQAAFSSLVRAGIPCHAEKTTCQILMRITMDKFDLAFDF